MPDLSHELADFAVATGIVVERGDELGGDGDFRRDARVDFGRYLHRVPACVLHPRSVDELAACLRWLSRLGLPFKLRGCAHSAGGQTLSDGGAVIVTRALERILEDDPAGETIRVEAGISWLALFEHLQKQGRRPLVLTDNLRTSVGGTLAVGGFGDTSHLYGPQAAGVTRLQLVTPDGGTHDVAPGEPWFDYALCGRGRLGVIATATLRTMRRPSLLWGRTLAWTGLDAFVADAIDVAETARYEFFRARLQWDGSVSAVAGNLRERADDVPPPAQISSLSGLESLDLLAVARQDPHLRWSFYSPNLELVLPLPSGLALWQRLRGQLDAWVAHMPRGASVLVLPSATRLPLAPLPGQSARCLLVALRPELPSAEAARACVPWLRRLATQVVEAGGRIYAASIELGDGRLDRLQLGAAGERLASLAESVDPRALCNRS